MQASTSSEAQQPPTGLAGAGGTQPTCNLPPFFKQLPSELQDKVLRFVLCDFRRPETSDQANDGPNDGIYVEKCGQLAVMPWRMDTRILDHSDEEVQRRARRVMLVTNRLVYIKSESLNLLPIFLAGRVPIVIRVNGSWARSRVEVLSKYFFITHRIESRGHSITRTVKPWGQSRSSLKANGLDDNFVDGQQEFVILWEDLVLFCRALYGAYSGYHRFGACTRHAIRLHCPLENLLNEHIPLLHPSRLLQPYRETLQGFEKFTVQGSIEESLARTIRSEVGKRAATPRPTDIIEAIGLQMSKGDTQLTFNRPTHAAHAYARASQELLVLESRGVLPLGADSSPVPELASLRWMLDMRQANAWLTALQSKRAAAENSSTPHMHGDAHAHGGNSKEERRLRQRMFDLRELVYNATTLITGPPEALRYEPSNQEQALQLYYAAKADRLCNHAFEETWDNISEARRLDPGNAEIRREEYLIRIRVESQAW